MYRMERSIGCWFIKARQQAKLVSVCARGAIHMRSPYQPSRGNLVQPQFGVASPKVCPCLYRKFMRNNLALLIFFLKTFPEYVIQKKEKYQCYRYILYLLSDNQLLNVLPFLRMDWGGSEGLCQIASKVLPGKNFGNVILIGHKF